MTTTTTALPRSARTDGLARPARPAGRADLSAAPGRLRLTRRGRAVLVGLGLAVAFALGVVFSGAALGTAEPGSQPASELVVVAPGDTLWDIAAESAAARGESDVREAMAHIQRLNALDDPALVVGQRLHVPSAD